MEICYMLGNLGLPIESINTEFEKKAINLIEENFRMRLDILQSDKVISGYSTIESTFLGFPSSKPEKSLIYRVDNVISDLDKAILAYENRIDNPDFGPEVSERGWAYNIPDSAEELAELKIIKSKFIEYASEFFGTPDVSRWTKELDALLAPDLQYSSDDSKDYGNAFAKEAFNAVVHGAGYIMARATIPDDMLNAFNQSINGTHATKRIRYND